MKRLFPKRVVRNPLNLGIKDGKTVDKYGREFEFDEKQFEKDRKKGRVAPAVTSAKLKMLLILLIPMVMSCHGQEPNQYHIQNKPGAVQVVDTIMEGEMWLDSVHMISFVLTDSSLNVGAYQQMGFDIGDTIGYTVGGWVNAKFLYRFYRFGYFDEQYRFNVIPNFYTTPYITDTLWYQKP